MRSELQKILVYIGRVYFLFFFFLLRLSLLLYSLDNTLDQSCCCYLLSGDLLWLPIQSAGNQSSGQMHAVLMPTLQWQQQCLC